MVFIINTKGTYKNRSPFNLFSRKIGQIVIVVDFSDVTASCVSIFSGALKSISGNAWLTGISVVPVAHCWGSGKKDIFFACCCRGGLLVFRIV